MRIRRAIPNYLVPTTLAFFLLTVTTAVMAPPVGGPPGGFRPSMGRMHHDRVGPASGGSFTSRPRPRPARRPASGSTPGSAAQAARPASRTTIPRNEDQAKRQEVRRNYAARREQVRESYRSQRQQAREVPAVKAEPIQELRDDPPAQSQPIPEHQRERTGEARAHRREEIREEHWDHWHHHDTLGTVYEKWYFSEDDCQVSTVVDGITYYSCDGTWYQRVYSGGTVTYVVVDRPGSG